MSDVVIHARDLRKVYRLYAGPGYRFLDTFGLLGNRPGAYTEHAALDGINLDIRRGEKVAFIGRNGAGKSTLLKLITRVIEPTTGVVEIGGKLHALLQIGTGFHPDFTGRANVLAYLAQLGIAGQEADRLCAAAIEFSELEEYIDQPVKTYSTGMTVRLMFAASTVRAPDILVLDEVLGVGDAYFAQKSFERIHALCSGSGTTLLLVTHDVYSAMKLCKRFVWIDRGRVLMDGPSRDVVHAYELSIREQEEQRLRLRRMAEVSREDDRQAAPLYGQLQYREKQPPEGRVAIADIRVLDGSQELARISMGTPEQAPGGLSLELAPGEGNWGEVEQFEGRAARRFLPHGSIFHRLAFLIAGSEVAAAIRGGSARVELTAWADPGSLDGLEALVSSQDGRSSYHGEFERAEGTGWQVVSTRLVAGAPSAAPATLDGKVRYGSRAFQIVDVRFDDGAGHERLQFAIGSRLRVLLDYHINDPGFDERPTIIVAFQKDGITRAHRFWTDGLTMRYADGSKGTIAVVADPLLLGAGTYVVSVSAFKESFFDSKDRHQFFSANPHLLDMHSRAYEIVVRPSPRVLCNDVVFQHPSTWYVDGAKVSDTPIVRDRDDDLGGR